LLSNIRARKMKLSRLARRNPIRSQQYEGMILQKQSLRRSQPATVLRQISRKRP
jgi:hypothetical protein